METKKFVLGILLAVVVVFAATAVYINLQKNAPTDAEEDTLYQVSTIDALMLGVYDGVRPVGELKKRGDFGIGTFHGLDGEMIVLDGNVYQVKADGRVYPVPDTETTPFATVTFFKRDHAVTTSTTMNSSVFAATMEDLLPTGNMVYAVRMHGTFPAMKVRAPPVQQKPYPPLTEALKDQAVFSYTNTTGTVVGFYTPVFFKGVNVPGFHLHYLSDDHATGGHILDAEVPAGTVVEYDITENFAMALPTSGDFTGIDLSQDLGEALARVEK